MGESQIIHQTNIMTTQEDNTVICPKCDRTEKECDEQSEDKDNGNPITNWVPYNWGLSCDECYFKNHTECDEWDVSSDECGKRGKECGCERCSSIDSCMEDDDASINIHEKCCECDLTEKQYNKKKGYESNLSTLHYIGGKTYCPDCRDPENSDYEDTDTSEERC